MKIPSLLAQFLYSHQRLDLPGIGTFLLDNSSISAIEQSKQRSAILEGVTFEGKPGLKDSPELIEFIAKKTGKMKALAASDLESHLQLAQQFLNIGKPFAFEGIGIITKTKSGEMEFTAISVATDKVKEYHVKESAPVDQKEGAQSNYESFLSPTATKREWSKPVMAVFLVCGIGLAIWGGYEISRRANKTAPTASLTQSSNTDTTQLVPDSSAVTTSTIDTVLQHKLPTTDNYKYVLEVARSKRAFKRFNQLKSIQWQVQLETKDSVQYTLYMLLPAMADTTKTLDSLTAMSGRKVYIEYPGDTETQKTAL